MKILILVMIVSWGFAMTKEDVKKELVFDARDKDAEGTRVETEDLLKNVLISKYGFTKQEIIDLAVFYTNTYPYKEYINELDSQLRSISNLKDTYFTPLDIKKAFDQPTSEGILDKIFGNTGIPNFLQWLIVAGVGIALVPAVLRLFRKD